MSIINTFNTLDTVIDEVNLERLGVYATNDMGEHFDVYAKKAAKATLDDKVYIGEEVIELDQLDNGDFDYGTLPRKMQI